MKESKREIGYDVVRVIAMLFVIALHTNPKPYQNGSFGQELFLSVFYACNGLFFMLSGRFALSVKLDGAKAILGFYKQKFFSLIIPLLFFGTLFYLSDLLQNGASLSFGAFLEGLLRGFLKDFNESYLWFMFALIGMTLAAPFLGRMVQHMRDSELHLLAAIGLIWEIFSVWIGKNAGLGFAYNSWFLLGFTYYYFLGYYVYRTLEHASYKKIVMAAGLIAFILNAVWTWKMPLHSYNAHDLSPLYTVYVVGLYLLLCSIRQGSGFAKFLSWIAAQSYFVYLLHYILLKLWINQLDLFSNATANYLVHYLICAVSSILLAFLLNLAYKPVLRQVKQKS